MPISDREQEIIGGNISVLRRRLTGTAEQLDICLRQLTEIFAASGAEHNAEEVYSRLCNFYGEPDAQTRAVLCRHIASVPRYGRELEEKNLFGYGEGALPGTHGKIAYVRNKRNDEAFLELSTRVREAKAYYCHTFTEACEAVFDNACEFCILPISNNTDGRLYSFYSLIDRYELRICGAAVVGSSDDGMQKTEYALVGRTAGLPKNEKTLLCFEFSVTCDGEAFPYEIINAVHMLGGTVTAVGTQPLKYDDTGNKYYITVELASENALPTAFYLSMEYPRYTPLGLYRKNKTRS